MSIYKFKQIYLWKGYITRWYINSYKNNISIHNKAYLVHILEKISEFRIDCLES